MVLTNPLTQLYLDRRAEAAKMPPEERDYHALDQGKQSTKARHDLCLKLLSKELHGQVLDLGCGTGLMIDTLADAKIKPVSYLGVDGMEEHRQDVLWRLELRDVNGGFLYKDMDKAFYDLETLPVVSVGLLIGVMGFYGHHTNRQVRRIINWMIRQCLHGYVTFPRLFPDRMGDGYHRCFEIEDVMDLIDPLATGRFKVSLLKKEFAISW